MNLCQLRTNLKLESIDKLQELSILKNSLKESLKDKCY